ncbi:DUF45 domain-containing protein [Nonomuraea phyllanthi]|uniref:DUF45 domain-containing protein n=1 Tax=Nonomuraea phyllanthi TaxID=2219224 RepID=A0A5C4UWR1_9ACTN|nr:YgjP-like metallopeptidase domain-containing protein [Nonomuraea phyllanthi]KAB8183260.1 DUF45 domain-containing protein [Nonomuraea phyllanthi]
MEVQDELSAHQQALAQLGVDCRIEISARSRAVAISVAPGGLVTVRVPEQISPQNLVEIVQRRMRWLARSVADQTLLTPDHPVKQMVGGESYAVFGHNHRLLPVEWSKHPVVVRGRQLEVVQATPDTMAATLIHWYQARGQDWLGRQAPQLAHRLGVPLPKINVGDLRAQWGRCHAGELIQFHWALFQLPVRLIELVLAHELVHLIEAGHGKGFQRLLTRLIPDHMERSQALAEAGSRTWMGDVVPPK